MIQTYAFGCGPEEVAKEERAKGNFKKTRGVSSKVHARYDLSAPEDIILGHDGKVRDVNEHVHRGNRQNGKRRRALDRSYGVLDL